MNTEEHKEAFFMGEARRRKLAGYIKPEEPKKVNQKRHIIVGGPSTSMAAVMALLSQYPKLPK